MTSQQMFIEVWTDEHGAPPPSKWAICDTCRGEGTSTAYLGAYTQSDREEMGDEWYDFAEDVQRGVFDQPCLECDGSGKIREFTGPARAEWDEWQREAAEDYAIQRAESGYAW